MNTLNFQPNSLMIGRLNRARNLELGSSCWIKFVVSPAGHGGRKSYPRTPVI